MEEEKAPSGEMAKPGSRSRVLWVVIAVLVVTNAVTLAAALGGVFSAAPAKAPLRIGTLLSLTGGLSPFGPGDTKGANLAVAEINAAGGVLGQPIEVFNEDDQTVSTAAAAAATKLVTQNHVDAIVGAQFSGGSIQSLPILQQNGVVMVSPSATSVRLSDLSLTQGWFFRAISSDALQGLVAAKYLGQNNTAPGGTPFKYANVMVINNAYGIGLGAVFKQHFQALGGTVNDTIVVPEAQQDYTSYLTALFASNPQVVYFVAYPDTGLTVMKQWEQQRGSHAGAWDRQWVFSEGLQDQTLVDQLRSQGLDVTKIWGTAPAAPVSALYNDFVSRYKAANSNQAPVLYASHSYDCVYLIALAAQKAGAVDGASIKGQLRAVSGGLAPGGTVIHGGQWTLAVSTLASGGAVNWEGASGTENLNATNDPAAGSYEIWGVNSTFQISRLAFFGEALTQGAPPMTSASMAPRTAGQVSGTQDSFLGKVQTVAVLRRD
jgi:branched-chain amino acid transport system substrate-binding protein